jgi:hypothetical protein
MRTARSNEASVLTLAVGVITRREVDIAVQQRSVIGAAFCAVLYLRPVEL